METSFGIFVVIICLNLKEHTYSYHHTCKLKISTIRNEELNLCLLLDQRGQGLKGRRGGLRATLRETGQPAWQGAGCSRANHTSCFLYSCDSDIWEVLLMGRDRPPQGWFIPPGSKQPPGEQAPYTHATHPNQLRIRLRHKASISPALNHPRARSCALSSLSHRNPGRGRPRTSPHSRPKAGAWAWGPVWRVPTILGHASKENLSVAPAPLCCHCHSGINENPREHEMRRCGGRGL